MIIGELELNDDGNYEGISDDEHWRVIVAPEVLSEAHHILTMRGISRTQHNTILYDANTWVQDATLRGLDGVELHDL